MVRGAAAQRVWGFPPWVWALSLALGAITPMQHAWIAYFPAPGTAPTGLHVSDDVVFIHCMRMFDTHFYTPFASQDAPLGANSPAYFAAPFFWVYAALGGLGRALHIGEFMWLGIINGVGTVTYLLAAYAFLRAVAPRLASLAFLLFTLGGGPSGLIYIASALSGFMASPQFEIYFRRFTLSLFEGNPNVMSPRLYYTLPLAAGLIGLTRLLRKEQRARDAVAATALLLCASLINARLAPMFAVIGIFAAGWAPGLSANARRRGFLCAIVGPTIGAGLTGLALAQSPTFAANALGGVRDALPFSAYIADTLLFLPLVAAAAWRGVRSLNALGQAIAFAAFGYIAAFAVGYVAYQAYYGNLLAGRDYMVAVVVSDWAFAGSAIGLACWARLRRRLQREESELGWLSAWYLVFFATSISAFGAGWFMRFAPSRLLALMGFPLCLLAAETLMRLRGRRPGLARAWIAALLVCGVATTAVASLCFLGPLGLRPGRGAYSWTHSEWMTAADARVLAQLKPGRVLTADYPGPHFADVASLRPEQRSVLGMGMLNFSDVAPLSAWPEVYRFFQTGTEDSFRRDLARRWGVDYVFCSDTHPEDDAAAAELRRASWLTIVAEDRDAILFKRSN